MARPDTVPIVVVQTLPAESEHRQVAAVEKQIDLAHVPSRNPDSGRSPLLRDEGLKPQHPRGECAISQGIIGEQPRPASISLVRTAATNLSSQSSTASGLTRTTKVVIGCVRVGLHVARHRVGK